MFLKVLSFTAMNLLHVETVCLPIFGCIIFHSVVPAGSCSDINAVVLQMYVCFPKKSNTFFMTAEPALSASPHSNCFQGMLQNRDIKKHLQTPSTKVRGQQCSLLCDKSSLSLFLILTICFEYITKAQLP